MISRRRALGLLAFLLVAAGCSRNAAPPPPQGAPQGMPQGVGADAPADAFSRQRDEMVDALRAVVKDPRVLEAMRRVPRHEFVAPPLRQRSYVVNTPLQILENQTISAPDIVALMTEVLALGGSERVLEIGTGSGYQAAVLGELVPEVYSVEIRPALAQNARRTLEDLRRRKILNYRKLEVIVGDGFRGYAPAAPYDAIIVTAAPRQVPTELLNQLKPLGRMVIPVGDFVQELQLIQKAEDGSLSTRSIIPVRFVPMVGGE